MVKLLSGSLAFALVLPAVTGCAGLGISDRQADWNFTGANQANLARMLDNPTDLVRGRSEPKAGGQMAVAAAVRLRRDAVKPLPSVDTQQISASGSSGASGSSQTGGGAAATSESP